MSLPRLGSVVFGGAAIPDPGRLRALEPREAQKRADLSHREMHCEGQGGCQEPVQGGLTELGVAWGDVSQRDVSSETPKMRRS